MFKLFKKKEIHLGVIAPGRIIEITEVPDAVFSGKMVGDGFAVLPEEGKFFSPVDGEIVQIFPTGHAVGIRSNEGVEILIHIGIDTVELKGEGFKAYVKKGQQVKKGDLLIEADLELLKANGKHLHTPIVFTEAGSYASFAPKYGDVKNADTVCVVKL